MVICFNIIVLGCAYAVLFVRPAPVRGGLTPFSIDMICRNNGQYPGGGEWTGKKARARLPLFFLSSALQHKTLNPYSSFVRWRAEDCPLQLAARKQWKLNPRHLRLPGKTVAKSWSYNNMSSNLMVFCVRFRFLSSLFRRLSLSLSHTRMDLRYFSFICTRT